MQKLAIGSVLDARISDGRTSSLMRNAHRVSFEYTPKHGMLYVRSRMISSRCNDNYDEFPADEIEAGYLSFVGKPVFVNHHNENHHRMRGVIIDAALHRDANRDGSPDTWVEGLMEVDALTFPRLAKAVIKGDIDRTSMGVDVAFSFCAVCENRATTPLEYCRHIPAMKGSRVQRHGETTATLVRERCHGLAFFENSLLVEDPADPTAYTLGNVELGPGLEHLSSLRPRETLTVPNGPGQRVSVRVQPNHRTASRSPMSAPPMPRPMQFTAGGRCPACYGLNTIAGRDGQADCFDCEHRFQFGQQVVMAVHREAAPRHADPGDHPFFQQYPVHHDHIVAHWDAATSDEQASGKRWYPDAHLVAKGIGTLHSGEHPRGNTHLAAGMIANYSPQTGWAANQHNAARVLHSGEGIGGKGSGVFASAKQKDVANKLLAGASHEDVMISPKVGDFAHLVEHGGDKDPAHPHVVVDRHALAVASQHPDSGERLPDDHYDKFPNATRHYYNHVVDAYHRASAIISDRTGEHVPPHAVQATTWLARQRLNQGAEHAIAQATPDAKRVRLDRAREKIRGNEETRWSDFRQQHLPDMKADPGTGYSRSAARGRRGRHEGS